MAGKTTMEVARLLGVSAETVKKYEERGVVKATRDAAGYRRFTSADVRRLQDHQYGRRPGRLAK